MKIVKLFLNFLFFFHSMDVIKVLLLFNSTGEGVVPEQEDEVEKSERRPARGSGS